MAKAAVACFVFGTCYFYLLDAPAALGSDGEGAAFALRNPAAQQHSSRLSAACSPDAPIPIFRNHLLLILRPKGGDSPRRHFYVRSCRREKLWSRLPNISSSLASVPVA